MKKIILKCTLIIGMMLGMVNPVCAIESKEEQGYVEIVGNNVIKTDENTYMIFESEEDLNDYLNDYLNENKAQPRVCLPGDPYYPTCVVPEPTTTTKSLDDEDTQYHYFLGFYEECENWSYADKYSFTTSKEQTFRITYNFDSSFSFEVKTVVKRGVKVSIPANPKIYSKLCVSADFNIKKYKYEVKNKNTGKLIKTYYGYETKVLDKYNDVYYKGIGIK